MQKAALPHTHTPHPVSVESIRQTYEKLIAEQQAANAENVAAENKVRDLADIYREKVQPEGTGADAVSAQPVENSAGQGYNGINTLEKLYDEAVHSKGIEGAGETGYYFKDEQLKTEPNTAYFWSGDSNGIGGKDFAIDYAAKNGGTTLESLMKSQGIEMPTWDITDPNSMKAWECASEKFAGQVSGEVHALIGSTQRQNSIWRTIELPRLLDNPYVSKIILVDPETLSETVFFGGRYENSR
ncbi:hypothetical protein IZU99_03165 [Oscillospiraceae bacterium CM]|nr:hypothetical protein IZU99_03165 [Oscillospiraceae bacterium CM]